MRRFIAGLFLLALGAAVVPAAADDAADIQAVIEDQVAAFAVGDAARAFSHATPAIQARFGSSTAFMGMVASAYSVLIRPTRFDIQKIETDGDRAAARARVTANDGRIFTAVYPLQRQPDGAWRIDGCYLEAAAGRAL